MPDFRKELLAALEGRYVIEREVSAGSMAVVYRAFDVKHERWVAIKTLRPEYLGAMEGDRFVREIRLLARLQHPHILPLFDSGEAAGDPYYVMPFVEGISLRERLQQLQHLTVDEAVGLTREVCDALSYAHRHDVLHRDIKPENIMLGGEHALVVDFGIARAIHVATAGEATAAGIVPGTPAYMSPEQASGDQALTERSDIYSLGCVLYEMLSGSAPHAASSYRAVLAARLTTPPRDLREICPDVPPRLAAAVAKALALDPLDRYESAAEFSAALDAALSTPVVPSPRRGKVIGAVAASAAAVAVVARLWTGGSAPRTDPSLFVVLPFATTGPTDSTRLAGADVARLVTDAIGRWRGVRLADDMRVRDLVSRRRGHPNTLSEARNAAAALGAGRLVWGVVERFFDGIDVQLALFDVGRGGEPIASTRRRLAAGAVLTDSLVAMTDELLTRFAGGDKDGQPVGTRDALALRAYLQGHAALSSFHIDSAITLFGEAGNRDSSFALAFYWGAQTRAWHATEGTDWEAPAARAISLSEALPPRQRQLASALLALARGEYLSACEKYSSMLAKDSLDFEAWFGRGECLTRDKLVIHDRSSPSGWRFRSSAHSAVSAYVRSLRLAPSFLAGVAVSRLESLLMATPNQIATGSSAGDTVGFAAYPGLAADTLVLVPWPAADLFASKAGTRPRTYVAAIDRNRELLSDVCLRFARENPRLAIARAHYALALENLAKIDTLGRAESALREILQARALPHGHADSVAFMATELRLLLKLQRAAEVKALADSMLQLSSHATGPEANTLASAAVLTGRLGLAVRLLRTGAREERLWTPRGRIPFPISVADPALELTVYAAVGAPGEMLRPMVDRTDQAISTWARNDYAPSLRAMELYVPAALAFPTAGLTRAHVNWHRADRYLDLQYKLSRKDYAAVSAALRALAEETANDRPGDAGTQFTLIDVLTRMSVGDTATARQLLVVALNSLPNAGRILTDEVSSVGALLRLWRLHSELSLSHGDTVAAVRSARIVATLLRDADPVLAPVLGWAWAVAGATR